MNVIGISGLHNSMPFKKLNLPGLSQRQYRILQGLDSAAALVTREGVGAAVAQERLSREKGTCSFPVDAIKYCLQFANLKPDDIDYVAHSFSYEPFRSMFDGGDDFIWRQFEAVYSKEALLRNIKEHLPGFAWEHKTVQVQHHLAHAASTFYLSGLKESLILVADGMGEIHSSTIAVGRGNEIEVVRQVPAPHSLGILYGVFTLHLGFYMNFDEGKVMGLAAYGDPRRYFNQIMDLVHLKDDGTYSIPVLLQNDTRKEKETYGGTLNIIADQFGPPRVPGSDLTKVHKDIAAALQSVLQVSLMHVLRHYKNVTGEHNLCMAGGVALNCTANGVIKRSRVFKNIFVQPAAGDDGSALGAALYIQRLHESNKQQTKMALPLWGPGYDTEEIRHVLLQQQDCKADYIPSFEDLACQVALRLTEGQIVAWFQGRMEFGPRALGNRSILVDPRDPEMRDRLNTMVKKREEFRPFAPAVTADAASRFFEINKGSEAIYASMLFSTQVRVEYRDKLPAITHVDGSARIQTVSSEHNPRLWALLHEFEKLTGIPVLLNTSFNVRGQPIVCTPMEAIETFLGTELDVLVIGDFLVVHKYRK